MDLTGPAGRLEALLEPPAQASGYAPDSPRAAVVFAHPHPLYGGTMHTKVVYQGAKALARIGCAVVRFNFRGVGTSEGAFDEGEGEQADFRAALDVVAGRYPGAELWAAGYSFGSWIALTVGARDPRVGVLIAVAPPVSKSDYDFSAVLTSAKPTFIIHGERDEIVPLADVRRFYARLPEPRELVVVEGADHLFDGKVSEVAGAIEDLLSDWETKQTAGHQP